METYTLQLGDIIVEEYDNINGIGKNFYQIDKVKPTKVYMGDYIFDREVKINPNTTDHYLNVRGLKPNVMYISSKQYKKFRLLRYKSEYTN